MERQTRQRNTVGAPASVSGITLFSGEQASLTLRPADAGDGLRFRRTDLEGNPAVPVGLAAVTDNSRHTVIADPESGVQVHTVEHVLSALAGLGITDAWLDLDGQELPIGDGSATLFTEAILQAGIRPLAGRIEAIVVREPLVVEENGSRIELLPDDRAGATYEYRLDYGPGSPIIAHDAVFRLDGGSSSYTEQIAPARTFSTYEEAHRLREAGHFTHLTPAEMLVIDSSGPIDNALRFPDEPARHKLLDLIGDLALAGRPIQGRVVAIRSGHSLNYRAARALVAHDDG